MERFDTIVIGGGPAGLMAAGQAAAVGERVLLVEKNASLGEKLLLAGKRRCNITNAESDTTAFLSRYGENGRFLFSAFSQMGPAQTIEFFNRIGIRTVVERGGRIFPAEGGGQRVLDALLILCKKGGVRILRNSPVRTLKMRNGRIERIVTAIEELEADRYIVATGGKSYPRTGSTGDGYRFAAQAGHTIVEPIPALVPVKTQETWVKLARGYNLRNVRLSVLVEGQKVDERFGEMEFTNFGVSGPIVMDLSSRIPEWMAQGSVRFSLDLKPALDLHTLRDRVDRDFRKHGDRLFAGALRDLVPGPLIPLILELSDVPSDKPAPYVSPEEKAELASLLKNIVLTVNGLWSFNHAIVTRGGVSLKEIDPGTMRSKLCENLHLAGEVLDLNGPSGGFNLQVCWSTGYVAGHTASPKAALPV
ncbi:NAD(P)/FAD-dependent oxidoreductase [Fretibacterium sp. OH1220_COT-178]|uniref:NAD(P)/FAD-dependent oxidoreductase n=1 Tax=Fretibacterium sp. OH1220_COT-178 TaxID=2491047 RepID=UPI000F5FDC2C|nr:NAD(P)/FAD-dependent oxidoreductase [Fretibacterium sp. OH1220_COT-178]RRD66243.1 NAD(P)/FAD-dependent oxidoreductase [Fretibacterium sp. OH1220_COT-178]